MSDLTERTPPAPPKIAAAPEAPRPPTAARAGSVGLVLTGAGLVLAGLGVMGPAVALGVGVALAVVGLVAGGKREKAISRGLIQGAIVLLGLRIDLHEVARAGAGGFGFAAGVIALTFATGWCLGRLLGTPASLTCLLSSGTAICGGSAIAATSTAIRAPEHHVSVALAVVFVLNAVALYVFPPLGQAMGLSEAQFGAWAAVAVHDFANVVATAQRYGEAATEDATVIKLVRVLWIAPVSAACAWAFRRAAAADGGDGADGGGGGGGGGRMRWGAAVPWFVWGFLAAAAARTAWPGLAEADGVLKDVAARMMAGAIFLIGCGLSVKAMRAVGLGPLAQGVVLWVVVSVVSLAVIRGTVG